jgi:YcxB-like protein
MTHSFTFELGAAEHARASRLVNLRRPVVKAMIGVSAVVALVGTGVFASGHVWVVEDRWLFLLLAWCIPVSVLLGLIIGPRVQARSMRRQNRAATGPHTYTLTDTGLEMSSTGTTTSLQWENVVEVFESQEFVLFYVAKTWAQLLPKRVIPQESLPSLRTDLVRWVGERAHVLA